MLDRRTRNRAVRTVNAAVTRFGLEHGVAMLALVEPLAGVRGHGLGLGMAARRARQGRFEDVVVHFVLLTTVEG